MLYNSFPEIMSLIDNVEKYYGAGQTAHYNMPHSHCLLENWGYRHTLRICNTYCFFPTTMVAGACLSVTWYLSGLSCIYTILLPKRYNLYKVLACSNTIFQFSLLCATFFQLLMFMLFISSKTSSSQRVLGLPIGYLDMGFHLLIFCTILSSTMRSTWPKQFNLCFLIKTIIFCRYNIPYISWLVLILQ